VAKDSKLEKKALATETKSEGMRMLLEVGYTVVEVKDIFEAPYGFVYGVARRAGLTETAAARQSSGRPPKAEKAKAKAPAKAKAAKAEAKPAPRTKAAVKGSKAKAKAKA
jgi:hypothetical protein